MKSFKGLKEKVDGLHADATKAAGGNRSAAIRVRVGMQEVKKMATEVRSELQWACAKKGGE